VSFLVDLSFKCARRGISCQKYYLLAPLLLASKKHIARKILVSDVCARREWARYQ
jgi:hypothetical protein